MDSGAESWEIEFMFGSSYFPSDTGSFAEIWAGYVGGKGQHFQRTSKRPRSPWCSPELQKFCLMRGKHKFKELYCYILSMQVKPWNDWQVIFHAIIWKIKIVYFCVVHLLCKQRWSFARFSSLNTVLNTKFTCSLYTEGCLIKFMKYLLYMTY